MLLVKINEKSGLNIEEKKIENYLELYEIDMEKIKKEITDKIEKILENNIKKYLSETYPNLV